MILGLQSVLIALALGAAGGAGLAGWVVWQFRAAQVLVAETAADELRGQVADRDTIIARQQRADADLRRSLDGLRAGLTEIQQDGQRRAEQGAQALAAVRRGMDTIPATIAALTARIQAPSMLTCADALDEWRREVSAR